MAQLESLDKGISIGDAPDEIDLWADLCGTVLTAGLDRKTS